MRRAAWLAVGTLACADESPIEHRVLRCDRPPRSVRLPLDVEGRWENGAFSLWRSDDTGILGPGFIVDVGRPSEIERIERYSSARDSILVDFVLDSGQIVRTRITRDSDGFVRGHLIEEPLVFLGDDGLGSWTRIAVCNPEKQ